MMPDKLNHYLEKWSLSDPQALAQTVTSHLYTVTYKGTRAVLKLLSPIGIHDEKQGVIALHYWDGHGAVRLLRDDEQAHLMEYAAGEDVRAMVMRGDDEQATAIIADVLNQLHASAKPPPDGLIPLKVRFGSLFKQAQIDKESGEDSIHRRAAPFAENLLDNQTNIAVLHGDMHHENVRHHSGRGWLAFDPKGLVGEKTFDAANTLCNPMGMDALIEDEARLFKNAGILASSMGVGLERVLAFTYAYACLSVSWSIEDEQDGGSTLRVAEIIEPHL